MYFRLYFLRFVSPGGQNLDPETWMDDFVRMPKGSLSLSLSLS